MFFLFFEKIFRLGVGFFIGAWVARVLGTEGFGQLSYATNFVFIFSAFCFLGMDSVVVHKLVNSRREDEREIISTVFKMKILGFLLMFIFVFFCCYLVNVSGDSRIAILIISFSFLFHAFGVFDFYFQAKVLPKKIALANVIAFIASSVFKLYLIEIEAGVLLFSLSFVIEYAVLGIILFFLYKIHHKTQGNLKVFNYSLARDIFLNSWPYAVSGFISAIALKIDQIIIKEILGLIELGKYSAALRISDAWLFVPGIITNMLFPGIIKSKEMGEVYYERAISILYKKVIFSGLAWSLVVWISSDFLIQSFYGNDYIKSAGVLKIYAWCGIFQGLLLASGKIYLLEKSSSILIIRNIFYLFCIIMFNWVFLKDYGIEGAAYSSLIAMVLSSYVLDLFSNSTRKHFFLKTKSLFIGFK